ncbi:MAG: pyridoxal-dependent decarboxylase [Patescibacteria group bacterium]
MEKKIIDYLVKLLKAKNKEMGGYLTSGGTEANIFAMWLGRNSLQKSIKTNQIIVLKTSLTHYSIEKATDLVGLNYTDISIDSKFWGMSLKNLEETIKKEYKKGKKGFLIPLTLGYTITGSDDPIKEINNLINKLKNQYKEIKFFCWIDAAFSGIVKPFLEENFTPFSYNNIQAFLTDFHKVMAVPYQSGIIIYRKNLIKNIENEVTYIGRKDTTLLGSRSGSSAIITWFTLISLGQDKIIKIIEQAIKEKNIFIKQIQKKIPNIKIINQKSNIQIGLVANSKNQKNILNKMNLEETKQKILLNGKNKKISIYKIYFLPFFKN